MCVRRSRRLSEAQTEFETRVAEASAAAVAAAVSERDVFWQGQIDAQTEQWNEKLAQLQREHELRNFLFVCCFCL